MEEAVLAGLADVVTYNTMVKAYLQCGDLVRLFATVAAMRSQGGDVAPNVVTFNEIIGVTSRMKPACLLVQQLETACEQAVICTDDSVASEEEG